MSRRKSDKSLTFEQAIDELESIIEKIESGEIGLESALRQFERGTVLIGHCREILDTAEKRIAELVSNAEGDLEVVDETDEPEEAEAADDEVEAEEDEEPYP